MLIFTFLSYTGTYFTFGINNYGTGNTFKLSFNNYHGFNFD